MSKSSNDSLEKSCLELDDYMRHYLIESWESNLLYFEEVLKEAKILENFKMDSIGHHVYPVSTSEHPCRCNCCIIETFVDLLSSGNAVTVRSDWNLTKPIVVIMCQQFSGKGIILGPKCERKNESVYPMVKCYPVSICSVMMKDFTFHGGSEKSSDSFRILRPSVLRLKGSSHLSACCVR